MLVKERMTSNPICGHPEMPVTEAQEIMRDNEIRHLPVLNEEERLVGLITQRSLLGALPSDMSKFGQFEINYVLAKIKVRDVMAKDLVTIDGNTAIEEAARVMADEKVGCLPVMQDAKLVGIITDNDLFTIMVDLLGARRPGIRVTVLQPDRTGEIARLTTAIARQGGYLSVCVGYYPPTMPENWTSVCKVLNIDEGKLVEIINGLEDMQVQDVRETLGD